ncbi:MAG TPA: DUF1707 domain-containing protein [Chloroflexota bacterium]|nr:DUF1707 domain-containing protein [Chloroflexota bacterium]
MSDSANPSNSNRLTMRVADADRERVAELLRQNFSEGRLTYAEFQERLEQAYASKTFADLDTVTADLPAPAPARPDRQSVRRARTRNHVITYVTIMVFLIIIWAITSPGGYFWPIWPILGWGIAVVLDVLHIQTHHDRHSRRHRR